MRNSIVLIVALAMAFGCICISSISPAWAQNWEDRQYFGSTAPDATELRILSSTDTSFFAPIIQSFLASHPDVAIEYLVTGTADIEAIFRQDADGFDLVISSAMDLQLKLVNDGLAAEMAAMDHPDWASWRQSLFAFTIEPAAIVINKQAFDGLSIPSTRQELIAVLRANPRRFRDRLGTYDVRQSGLGYLFATQDARASETYWRLMEVMGGLGTRLYCCSGEMIDDLETGKILVAYNVLSSYALARKERGDRIEIILPADFPTTMMRTAMISKTAPNPETAERFLTHLLGVQSRPNQLAKHSLPPLRRAAGQQTISLEPALMTYLDRLKRRTFVTEWERAIIQ